MGRGKWKERNGSKTKGRVKRGERGTTSDPDPEPATATPETFVPQASSD